MPNDFKYSDRKYNRDRYNRLIDLKGVTLFKYLKNIGTKIFMRIMGGLHIEGDLTVGGNDIKDFSKNTVLSFDGTGGVDKIGDDTPSSGEFLKWDGSKAVWDTASGTTYSAGTLLDLSTTTFNVDLTEASAQTIVAGDYILFLDGGTTGSHAKGSINDVATLFAGTAASTGLSASSGVLSVSDLHPVGVDGSANQLLTDDGDGTVTSESNLTFTGSTMTIGDGGAGAAQVEVKPNPSGNGGRLYFVGGNATDGQTNAAGGHVFNYSGRPTGNAAFGFYGWHGGTIGASGTTLRSSAQWMGLGGTATTTDLILYSHQDAGDKLAISVATHGATTITTTDDDAAAANLDFSIDGTFSVASTGIDIATDGTITNATWNGTAVADGYVANDLTISGGTVNNSIIGGSTPAAITGTTIDANTDFTVGTTVITDDSVAMDSGIINCSGTAEVAGTTVTLNSSGDIELNADGGDITFKDASVTLAALANVGSAVMTGGQISTNRKFTKDDSTTVGNFEGDVVYFGGTGTMTIGKIYYFATTGAWVIANCDDVDDSTGLLAVALGSTSDTHGMLLRGTVTLATIDGTNNEGIPLYLDATDGDANIAFPTTSTHVARIIGYCLHATTKEIWFNPDNTWVEIA